MIMIFGPAGAGKSTQAGLLAEKLGRRALSVGQICREEFHEYTKTAAMVPVPELVRAVMRRVNEIGEEKVVLDGQPWEVSDVSAMRESGMIDAIEVAVVLDVSREECLKRLADRGREDDKAENWNKKLAMYEQKIDTFLNATGVEVVHVDGSGTISEVGNLVMSALRDHLPLQE